MNNSNNNFGNDVIKIPTDTESQPKQAVEVKSELNKYSHTEMILSFFFWLIGILFVRCFFLCEPGIGGTIIAIILAVLSAVTYMKRDGKEKKTSSVAAMIILGATGVLYSITGNWVTRFLLTAFLIASYLIWYYYTFACDSRRKIGRNFSADVLKSVVVMPFSAFGDIYGATGSAMKDSKSGRRLLWALAGLGIALIPTAIVTSQLSSGDAAFGRIVSAIFNEIGSELVVTVLSIIVGIPVAMYLYGMFHANYNRKNGKILTDDSVDHGMISARKLNVVTSYFTVIPLLIIYTLFFASQFAYFTGAFSGLKIPTMSYAEYARSGFFELCRVTGINVAVICFLLLFTRRPVDNGKSRKPLNIRILISVLSIYTLALISTALSKMVLYINQYGLTRLRLYTTWFMVLLGIMFVVLILGQIFKRVNFFRTMSVVFIIMFAVLIFAKTDALIAHVNIDRYLTACENGENATLDTEMLCDLSTEAAPVIFKLKDDPKYGKTFVRGQYSDIIIDNHRDDKDLNYYLGFNYDNYRAYKTALELRNPD